MNISFPDLADSLRESAVQFLWDQWTALGAGGGGRIHRVAIGIDPEALLLMTTRFVDDEPRLEDICCDWLAENGRLIHLQRLKNVQKGESLGDEEVLARIASRMSVSGNVNWKSLAKTGAAMMVAEDPAPLKKRLARTPDPYSPGNFICRMRNYFGMTARAEVFFWLLTHPSGHAAEIARDSYWLPKTVQLILGEFGQAGIVSVHEKGRQKVYSIADKKSWSFFNQSDAPLIWFTQPAFYRAFIGVLQVVEALAKKEQASDDLKAIIIEREIPSIRNAFARSGELTFLSDWKQESAHGRGLDYFKNEATRLHSTALGELGQSAQYRFPSEYELMP